VDFIVVPTFRSRKHFELPAVCSKSTYIDQRENGPVSFASKQADKAILKIISISVLIAFH